MMYEEFWQQLLKVYNILYAYYLKSEFLKSLYIMPPSISFTVCYKDIFVQVSAFCGYFSQILMNVPLTKTFAHKGASTQKETTGVHALMDSNWHQTTELVKVINI